VRPPRTRSTTHKPRATQRISPYSSALSRYAPAWSPQPAASTPSWDCLVGKQGQQEQAYPGTRKAAPIRRQLAIQAISHKAIQGLGSSRHALGISIRRWKQRNQRRSRASVSSTCTVGPRRVPHWRMCQPERRCKLPRNLSHTRTSFCTTPNSSDPDRTILSLHQNCDTCRVKGSSQPSVSNVILGSTL
jgi:hypothetical protein